MHEHNNLLINSLISNLEIGDVALRVTTTAQRTCPDYRKIARLGMHRRATNSPEGFSGGFNDIIFGDIRSADILVDLTERTVSP